MILFLNKKDLFGRKITLLIDQKSVFRNMQVKRFSRRRLSSERRFASGLNTYEPSLQYIQEQFEKVDQREKINNHQRELYVHVTCATDTETMQFVFDAISDMIIQTNLIHAGIF